jgi:glycosyltransferase involved in cell wall biosynthesis
LKQAIQSILDQTYTNFTLMIINDGSTDKSEDIIRDFKDRRIKYIKHEANSGLICTLNEGLDLAESKYIIRMDADDISLPERFEKQVSFMEANPDIGISGTWLSIIDSDHFITHPASNEECKVMLLQNTVLGHPSAILRREPIIKNNLRFDKHALYAEDYKFWADASINGLKLANIPEVLVHYRTHEGQVSAKKASEQLQTVKEVKLWYVQHFFSDLLKTKLQVYTDLLDRTINSFVSFLEARALIKQLKINNSAGRHFDALIFDAFFDNLLKIASFRIYVLCADCNRKVLWSSIFDRHFYASTTAAQKVKFIFRSVLKGSG